MWSGGDVDLRWHRDANMDSTLHRTVLLPQEIFVPAPGGFFRCPKVTFYEKDLVIRATPANGVNFIPYMKLLGVE
jgi:hypothetical protein